MYFNHRKPQKFWYLTPTSIHYICSMVFWVGDLNYRLNDISNDSVKQLIAKREYTKLMQYDQVRDIAIIQAVFAPSEYFP